MNIYEKISFGLCGVSILSAALVNPLWLAIIISAVLLAVAWLLINKTPKVKGDNND